MRVAADGRVDDRPSSLAAQLAEDMAPGAELAEWLSAIDLADLSRYHLAGAAASWRRLSAWAQACELTAVAEMASRAAARDSSVPVREDGSPARVPDDAADEVALALGMSRTGGAWWVDLATTLTWRLPDTLAALRRGRIDLSRARLIAEATRPLSEEDARTVQDRILPDAGDQTLGQLRAALRQAVISVDKEAAERRRREAERKAKVGLYGDDEGTATLSGQNLPGAQSAAAMARITALARAMKAAGASDGIHLLRAKVFLGLLLGTLPFIPPADGHETPEPEVPPTDGRDGNGPDGRRPDGRRPDGNGPDSGIRGSGRPGSGRPGSDGPGTSRPETSRPETSRPETSRPETSRPENSRPGNSGAGRKNPAHSPRSGSSKTGAESTGSQPDAGRLGGDPPDAGSPAAGDPDAPTPDAPTPDAPTPDADGPDATGARSFWREEDWPSTPDPDSPDDIHEPDDPGEDADDDEWLDVGPPGTPCNRAPGWDPSWPGLPLPGEAPAPGCAPLTAIGSRQNTGKGSPSPPAMGRVRLTVAWPTLAGLSSEPGKLCWLGPVTPGAACLLARAAAADPACEWRLIVTGPTGQAIAVGRIPLKTKRRRHGAGRASSPSSIWTPCLIARVTVIVPAEFLSNGSLRTAADAVMGSADGEPLAEVLRAARDAADVAWRESEPSLADPSRCDHRMLSSSYRPPTRLRELVEARDQTCRSPNCRQPAWRADKDHTTAFDQGGLTCSCNLGAECRTHHQLKQNPHWRVAQPTPGTFVWTTPSGRTHTVIPPRLWDLAAMLPRRDLQPAQ